MSKLTVVGEIDTVDLRKVTHQASFLYSVMRKFNLKHLQCVCYMNRRKYKPRFRLVINISGIPFLDLPPIDDAGKYSMYLRVSEHLAKFARLNDTRVKLTKISEETRERIRRQQERKKKKV